MTVFKKNTTENIQERKFVGANLPLQTHSFLTMYALSVATSKSSIVNDLVSNWHESNEITVKELEKSIAEKAAISFKASNKKGVEAFTDILERELIQKGVEISSVKNIIKLFTNEANQ